MTNEIKILSGCSNETIKKALERCSGSEEAKKRALNLVNDFRTIETEIKKMFNR